jgi:glycosyltransferase involved in cell wall biosynthesis
MVSAGGRAGRVTKRILYIQYTNPACYPPLEHGSTILANDGWGVLFLGTEVAGTEALVFPERKGVTVKLLPACGPGLRQKLHYFRYCLLACYHAISFRPQWIYASDPLSAPVALLLKVLMRRKVVYHEHDSPSTAEASRFIRLCLAARAWLGHNADIIIFPNAERGRVIAKELQLRRVEIQCVWNCPAESEAVSVAKSSQGQDIWLLYHGSIVPDRLPLAVVHALVLLPDQVKLRVIGYETSGSSGYVEKMFSLARECGVYHRIEFLGTIPRRSVLAWCRKSDVGISFMPMNSRDINIAHMAGASNKPFDNLACGLPLLVSSIPEWQRMFVEPGYALACDPQDSVSIASAVRRLVEHPEEMRAMGERGRRRIAEEWNYERQFAPVVQKLNEGCLQ